MYLIKSISAVTNYNSSSCLERSCISGYRARYFPGKLSPRRENVLPRQSTFYKDLNAFENQMNSIEIFVVPQHDTVKQSMCPLKSIFFCPNQF